MVKLDIFQKYFLFFSIAIVIIRLYFGNQRLTLYKKSFNPIFDKISSILNSLGMAFFPLMNIFFSFFEKFEFEVPTIIKTISVIFFCLATIIFYLSHKELGNNWSPIVAIKENQKLIKTGIYKYIRHPMYLSVWIFAIFEGFLLSNYFLGIFAILFWTNLYFFRVSNEEKIMIDTFGKEYEEYIENTGRIFPKLKSKKKLK